jgi:hypothetical protein
MILYDMVRSTQLAVSKAELPLLEIACQCHDPNEAANYIKVRYLILYSYIDCSLFSDIRFGRSCTPIQLSLSFILPIILLQRNIIKPGYFFLFSYLSFLL